MLLFKTACMHANHVCQVEELVCCFATMQTDLEEERGAHAATRAASQIALQVRKSEIPEGGRVLVMGGRVWVDLGFPLPSVRRKGELQVRG